MAFETLQMKIAAQKAIPAAMFRIARITGFATGFSEAETAAGTAVIVPLFDAGEAGDFNADSNNYAGTEKGVTGVEVPLNQHLVKSLTYTDKDFTECAVNFWQGAGYAIGKTIGSGMSKRAQAVITKANFAQELVMTAAQAAVKTTLTKLFEAAAQAEIDPADASLLLNPTYFAAILSVLDASTYGGQDAMKGGVIPGLYGFENVVCSTQLPQTEGENLVGAIIHKEAIAVAGRPLPPQSRSAYEETGIQTDPGSGLSIGFRRFGDPKTGRNYIAGEAIMGVKPLQGTKAIRIVSAATA